MVCGYSEDYLKSIEVVKLRLKNDGSVSSVSRAWDIFEPKDLIGRFYPLLAELKNNKLLIYGGKHASNVIFDGIIIDTRRKSLTDSVE